MELQSLWDQIKSRQVFSLQTLPPEIRRRRYLTQELDRLETTGRLRRVRRGLYVVATTNSPSGATAVDPFLIASQIVMPYAISFYPALAIRGLAESTSNRIYVQVPKRFSPFSFEGVDYVSVVTNHLFGFETHYRSGLAVQVTDIERTLLDGLRVPDYVGGLNEFLRSLEGLQRMDLMAEILELTLKTADLVEWKRFRADHEERRSELDLFASHGLLSATPSEDFSKIMPTGESIYLSLLGLSFCPHPAAAPERESAGKVFKYLREEYKRNPKVQLQCDAAAKQTGMDVFSFQRAVLALAPMGAGVHSASTQSSGVPMSVRMEEPVLDFLSADQLLARRLSMFNPPAELSLKKTPIVSIQANRLLEHLGRFNEAALYSKTGFMLRLFQERWKPPQEVFRQLAKHVGRKKNYFPHGLPKGSGRLIPEWNLIVPSHVHSRYQSATGGEFGGPRASL